MVGTSKRCIPYSYYHYCSDDQMRCVPTLEHSAARRVPPLSVFLLNSAAVLWRSTAQPRSGSERSMQKVGSVSLSLDTSASLQLGVAYMRRWHTEEGAADVSAAIACFEKAVQLKSNEAKALSPI